MWIRSTCNTSWSCQWHQSRMVGVELACRGRYRYSVYFVWANTLFSTRAIISQLISPLIFEELIKVNSELYGWSHWHVNFNPCKGESNYSLTERSNLQLYALIGLARTEECLQEYFRGAFFYSYIQFMCLLSIVSTLQEDNTSVSMDPIREAWKYEYTLYPSNSMETICDGPLLYAILTLCAIGDPPLPEEGTIQMLESCILTRYRYRVAYGKVVHTSLYFVWWTQWMYLSMESTFASARLHQRSIGKGWFYWNSLRKYMDMENSYFPKLLHILSGTFRLNNML